MAVEVTNGLFILNTEKTAYAFALYDGRFPVHLYYGARRDCNELEIPRRYNAFSPYYAEYGMVFSPDCACMEMPFFGNGDFRTSALKLRCAEGNCVTAFEYEGYEIKDGTVTSDALPSARAGEGTQTLCVRMRDVHTGCVLTLYYTVFPECDVITRHFRLENHGENDVKIEKAMSATLDIDEGDFDYITLRGAYPRERYYQREHVAYGMQSVCSRRGSSSHQFNPFIAVCEHTADEDDGQVYGMNLVWSGSHSGEIEKDQNGTVRMQTGLGEENFAYLLKSGESFEAPEAVLTFSEHGLNGMSRNFHRFIRAHILPPERFESRPVVLNTWEASYFDIDEDNLLRFADAAKECGIDMLVMDDGWFGHRDDDTSSLGDWYVNEKKFPGTLGCLIKKIKAKGIKFGIWIEPEMINKDSDLYRAHPEWVLAAPGRDVLLSRHQMTLDMSNPEVVDYLIGAFDATLGNLPIDYIKWDYNRNISAACSPHLGRERQDEVLYRNMLGVYRLFRWFNERFPGVMIENCSGGGGRFDLGMMKYSTQIWCSDQTEPGLRIPIQHGTTYAYPPSVISCHVSNANNLTGDLRYLDFAFVTALGGPLGYELFLPDMPREVKDKITEQIKEYRKWEHTVLDGDFYRVHNPRSCPYYSYYYVSRDGGHILAAFLQEKGEEPHEVTLCIKNADSDRVYISESDGREYTGEELSRGITLTTSREGHFARVFSLYRK